MGTKTNNPVLNLAFHNKFISDIVIFVCLVYISEKEILILTKMKLNFYFQIRHLTFIAQHATPYRHDLVQSPMF